MDNVKPRTVLTLGLFCGLVLALAQLARSESAVSLPLPPSFGEISAGTYDDQGRRIGEATFAQVRLENGNVLVEATSGIKGSASTHYLAEMQPGINGDSLRLVRQESRSRDKNGKGLGFLAIDHSAGIGSCKPPTWSSNREIQQIKLPRDDRVVNVPLHLLFLPLVQGGQQEIRFQIMACRPEPKIYDAIAKVSKGSGLDKQIVEVQYKVVLGMWNRLASPFIPVFSVWFDQSNESDWIGHRVPLYMKGPIVLILRSGVTPSTVGAGN